MPPKIEFGGMQRVEKVNTQRGADFIRSPEPRASAGRGGYMICAPYPRRIKRRGRKNGNLPLAPP